MIGVLLLLLLWTLAWFLHRKYPAGLHDALRGSQAYMRRRYGSSEIARVPGKDHAERVALLREHPDAGVAHGSAEEDHARGFRWGFLVAVGSVLICFAFFPGSRLWTGLALVMMAFTGLIIGAWHLLNGR